MNLTDLIHHPERMDRETLYDLRSLIALHPYYQTARLLMLQNLYLLHDPTFDEELRCAAIYITDRRVLFNLIEAAHYRLRKQQNSSRISEDSAQGNRTTELIDSFLGQIPKEEEKTQKRKPTPADASVDYVSYLLESGIDDLSGADNLSDTDENTDTQTVRNQGSRTTELIDNFMIQEGGKITLPELEEGNENATKEETSVAAPVAEEKSTETPSESVYTETMARIYVLQGRYSQALEIIKRLNLDNSKKNAYFADQIRFLEKLIVNNNKKQK